MTRFIGSLVLLSLVAACEPAGPTAPRSDVDFRIEVDDAWVRQVAGTDTARVNSAAYFTLTNHSSDTLALLGARTDAASRTEIHQTRLDENVMRMRPVDRVTVPPNESLAFEPGGLHIMLVDLQRDLLAGDSLSITFSFDDGTEEVTPFMVRPAAPERSARG